MIVNPLQLVRRPLALASIRLIRRHCSAAAAVLSFRTGRQDELQMHASLIINYLLRFFLQLQVLSSCPRKTLQHQDLDRSLQGTKSQMNVGIS